jgi:3-hydroxybutyryl-CoA dehydrogenase
MSIKTIGILGAGTMGGGIAYQAALSGFDVIICDVEQRFVDGAIDRAAKVMDKNIEKQKMTPEEKEAVLSRIKTTINKEDFSNVDIVIEAIIENLEVKKDAFIKLDQICKPEAVLATNTSSMSISQIASVTKRSDKVVGMHFFNPVHMMRLIELVRGLDTSDETLQSAAELGEALGKTIVVAQKDTPGFIVNRLLFAQMMEAARMYEEGIATPEDIDTAVRLGLNYPVGPFAMMDFGGMEMTMSVADYLYNETKDPKWYATHTMRSLYRSGKMGKKTGQGWFKY